MDVPFARSHAVAADRVGDDPDLVLNTRAMARVSEPTTLFTLQGGRRFLQPRIVTTRVASSTNPAEYLIEEEAITEGWPSSISSPNTFRYENWTTYKREFVEGGGDAVSLLPFGHQSYASPYQEVAIRKEISYLTHLKKYVLMWIKGFAIC